MQGLFWFATFIALAIADVSHLFKRNRPTAFNSYVTRKPLPVAPVSSLSKSVASVPSRTDSVAAILRSSADISPDGSYQYAYETGNGIAAEEKGQQKLIGSNSGNTAQGSFQYRSPEGVPVVVQYVADENGFQPHSDLLPTPPPVPAAILRALEWIAAHPQPQVKKISKVF